MPKVKETEDGMLQVGGYKLSLNRKVTHCGSRLGRRYHYVRMFALRYDVAAVHADIIMFAELG